MIDWFFTTLKTYPEIAIFLALALGYYFGKFTYKGIGLGAVTATLIAAVVIGQIGITISQPLKAFSFLMFLFAVGYAVGPQFVRGIASSGLPQAIFSVVLQRSPVTISATRPDSTRDRRQFLLPWASQPTQSTVWAWPPTKPRLTSITCRSLTP